MKDGNPTTKSKKLDETARTHQHSGNKQHEQINSAQRVNKEKKLMLRTFPNCFHLLND